MKLFRLWPCIEDQTFYNPPSVSNQQLSAQLPGGPMNKITTLLLWLTFCLSVLANLSTARAHAGRSWRGTSWADRTREAASPFATATSSRCRRRGSSPDQGRRHSGRRVLFSGARTWVRRTVDRSTTVRTPRSGPSSCGMNPAFHRGARHLCRFHARRKDGGEGFGSARILVA